MWRTWEQGTEIHTTIWVVCCLYTSLAFRSLPVIISLNFAKNQCILGLDFGKTASLTLVVPKLGKQCLWYLTLICRRDRSSQLCPELVIILASSVQILRVQHAVVFFQGAFWEVIHAILCWPLWSCDWGRLTSGIWWRVISWSQQDFILQLG